MTRANRLAFRVAFAAYSAALLLWLGLGLVAELVDLSPGFHSFTARVAAGSSIWNSWAKKLLSPMLGMNMTQPNWSSVWGQYLFSVVNVTLALWLLARRPDERVPRLLAVAFLGTAATFNLPSHAVFHLVGSPWPIAAVHFLFHLLSGLCYAWAVILFPDGHLPRRWRSSFTAPIMVLASLVVLVVCWRGSFLSHPQFFVVFFGALVPLIGVSAQLSRLTDRETPPPTARVSRLLIGAVLPAALAALAWLIAWALGAVAGPVGRFGTAANAWVAEIFPAVFALIPLVLTVGVIRYRLWDIDRALSRVLAYFLMTAGAGLGLAVVVVAAAVITGGPWWWPVVLLALLATVAEPIWRRTRRLANRVVFGQTLSPSEAVSTLALGLRQFGEGGDLPRLIAVAVAATRIQRASVWVESAAMLVCLADSHQPAGEHAAVSLDEARDPADWAAALGATETFPIDAGPEAPAALAVVMPPGTGLTRIDRRVLAELAGHAGPLVRNADLTVRLAREVAELARQTMQLQQVRRRVVAAQDVERRRLERNLHDGAQQSLVAALIGLRMRSHLDLPADELRKADRELADILSDASVDIAQLCAGAPPPVMESGLGPAVRRLAERAAQSAPTVSVKIDPDVSADRSEVAVAAYFCCAEALQNIAKHAAAASISVEVGIRQERLWFCVADDGRGFSRDELDDSIGGLGPLPDRLMALGGELSVQSSPGKGTVVTGSAPIRPHLVASP